LVSRAFLLELVHRKRELMILNVSFNNIEYLPPELGDLVLLK